MHVKKLAIWVVTTLLIVGTVVALAGCGGGATTTGGETSGTASAAPLKIALLLPETKTARYETQDKPLFEAKVKELAPDAEILYSNANQDAALQQSQADAAITNGAQVLVLDPVDSASAASIVTKAKAAKHPGHQLRPSDSQRAGRLLHLVRQREGRHAAGPGAARQADR